MQLTPSAKIYIANSKIENAGRGIFATRNIKIGEIIEVCPIILINEGEVPYIRKTKLHNYYFMWGDEKENHKAAICLGLGSLYNHSYSPNATYKKHINDELIEFIAITDINKDQEISVNYNYGNPNDNSKLWIDEIPPDEDTST